jgi:hypothetical protein
VLVVSALCSSLEIISDLACYFLVACVRQIISRPRELCSTVACTASSYWPGLATPLASPTRHVSFLASATCVVTPLLVIMSRRD